MDIIVHTQILQRLPYPNLIDEDVMGSRAHQQVFHPPLCRDVFRFDALTIVSRMHCFPRINLSFLLKYQLLCIASFGL